jgi:hypothetical protein
VSEQPADDQPTQDETAQDKQPTKAVEIRTPIDLSRPLADFDAAWRLAKNLALSSLLPTDLKGRPQDTLVVMMTGAELGLRPMQSIMSVHPIDGRPSIGAHLWVSLARGAGHKVRVIEQTPDHCTMVLIRRDDPEFEHAVTYTIDDAVQAGLCQRTEDGTIRARSGKGRRLPWEANTGAMLYARCASTLVRRACPEVALGVLDEVEAESMRVESDRVDRLAEVAADRPPAEGPPESETVPEPPPVDDEALREAVARVEAEHLDAGDDWPEVAQPPNAGDRS